VLTTHDVTNDVLPFVLKPILQNSAASTLPFLPNELVDILIEYTQRHRLNIDGGMLVVLHGCSDQSRRLDRVPAWTREETSLQALLHQPYGKRILPKLEQLVMREHIHQSPKQAKQSQSSASSSRSSSSSSANGTI
jgi:hypothetical protein